MFLAIDYGEARCGLALGEKLVAKLWTVQREKLFSELSKFPDVEAYVVGLPFSMSGRYSKQTFRVIAFAEKLHKKYGKSVYMIDERLSSKIFKGSKDVDRLSAAEIFDRFISSDRNRYEIKPPSRLNDEKIAELKSLVGKILIANLSDTRVARDEDCVVYQVDPYYAYLFYKRGFHVERDRTQLENSAPFDIIVAGGDCEEFRVFLRPSGKILCL
ncbi:RuvX/YqgF family protein [Pseudothermotoga sp. U03pept]|uniref:RuvX/YqgF family protein n=1 Tax=Pseudothermotoga sp. U03pept TaxID=3447012 RepID=UPI003F0024B3